jgi:hypothetical protein
VLARQRELRGGQGQRLREATNPTSRARVTFEGRAKQFTGLSAKLIEIGAFRQLAHRVFLRAGVRGQALKENGLQPAFERVVEVDSVLPADPEASSKRRVDHTRRWTTRAILFIGNSYTTVNDLPSVFANLARSGGHRVEACLGQMGHRLDEGCLAIAVGFGGSGGPIDRGGNGAMATERYGIVTS